MRFSKSSVKGKVHNSTSLPQETRKRRNEEPQVSRRKDIIKIRAEINENKQVGL